MSFLFMTKEDQEPHHHEVGILGMIEHKAKKLARTEEEAMERMREDGPRL
jgi:hypothetical protein